MSDWCYFFPQGIGNTCWRSHSDLNSFCWKANESRLKFFFPNVIHIFILRQLCRMHFLGTCSFYLNLNLPLAGDFLGSDYFCPFFLLVSSEFISVLFFSKNKLVFCITCLLFYFTAFCSFIYNFPMSILFKIWKNIPCAQIRGLNIAM